MDRAIGEVMVARPGTRQLKALVAARGPAMHHRVGHVGMKLEAETMARPKRLYREVAALGQQFRAGRKVKSLAVPVIDMVRPLLAKRQPCRRRSDRVISDFGSAFRMRGNRRAELHGEHLRAQAN